MIRPQQKREKTQRFFKFPFFKYVCEILDKMVDESREDVSQQLNTKRPAISFNPARMNTKHKMETYMKSVMAQVQKVCTYVCIMLSTSS